MTLIDTSGNYGEGRSEELIKGVIAHACKYWRGARLFGSRHCAGLDHPQR
jgi:hypothetical protein